MKQTLFEQNGCTYTRQGDYLLPNIKMPDQRNTRLERGDIVAGSILSNTTGSSITIC